MTRIPTGPHWPGHSPTRETNESFPGVSPVPSECGLEPNGDDRPNPMVGFLRVYAEEEVNSRSLLVDILSEFPVLQTSCLTATGERFIYSASFISLRPVAAS
jgi:hypothetical protein